MMPTVLFTENFGEQEVVITTDLLTCMACNDLDLIFNLLDAMP